MVADMSTLIRKQQKIYPDKFRIMDTDLIKLSSTQLTRVPIIVEVDLSWVHNMVDIGCKHREEYGGKFFDIK